MSYADFDDVALRAGRFASVFAVEGRRPDQDDVEAILADVAGDIDAAIRGLGFDPTGISASVSAALVDLNAYGALARALQAANVGREGAALAATAQAVWDQALGNGGSFQTRTHPAIAELVAGEGGEGAVTGSDFWSSNLGYGTPDILAVEATLPGAPNTQPVFRKGQAL